MFDTRNDLPADTRISRDNDQYLWFLEAHRHATR
jgi:hypothetical protein